MSRDNRYSSSASNQQDNPDKKQKNQALILAIRENRIEDVRNLILVGADVNAADLSSKETPLCLAANNDVTDNESAEMVGLLLESGAKINTHGDFNYSPLHFAILLGHNETAKLLIKNGANINAINNDRETTLHLAAQYSETQTSEPTKGRSKTIRLLLENGADVNAVNKYKETPLHKATWKGRRKTVKLLLENGANVNAINDNQQTSLHFAAHKGYIKTVRLLLENGANIHAVNIMNQTPFEVAESDAEMLLGQYKKISQELLKILEGDGQITNNAKKLNEILLLAESDLNKDPNSIVASAELTSSSNPSSNPVLDINNNQLLSVRALINMPLDKQGNNLMHLLALKFASDFASDFEEKKSYSPSLDLLSSLILLGGRVDIKNSDGQTAIDLEKREKSVSVIEEINQLYQSPELLIKLISDIRVLNKETGVARKAEMPTEIVDLIAEFSHNLSPYQRNPQLLKEMVGNIITGESDDPSSEKLAELILEYSNTKVLKNNQQQDSQLQAREENQKSEDEYDEKMPTTKPETKPKRARASSLDQEQQNPKRQK